ncbi:MAG: radical SAM protein [Flavobacteriales bacterium]|nr:radical SAM protein [Flavobacteriales bacterium]
MKVLELPDEQKPKLESGLLLPIMEEFYTIQGEGFHTGKPAYFIRIGGCDVGCHWCDVKESWDASIHPLVEVDKVVANAVAQPSKVVVVTGGEPLMFNLSYLTEKLAEEGIQVHVETSGAHSFSGRFDWICLSPKKTASPQDEYYQKAHELKVIVYNRHDFEWAEQQAQKVSSDCKLYLQPEWSRRETVLPQIIDYVMSRPKWNVSLQTHKYMNIP